MPKYKARIALGGLLVVAMLVGLAFELNYISGGTAIGTSSSLSLTQTDSTAAIGGQTLSTVDPKNGLRLSTYINTTDFKEGQKLNISVSVFNTLPTLNSFFPQRSFQYSAPGEVGNWTFYGVPLSTWPECSSQFPFGWPLPIEIVILKGNYTTQELSSIANTSPQYTCGDYAGIVPEYTFEPSSSLINVTFLAGGGVGYRTLGLFRPASNSIVDGYWNITSLARNNPPIYVPAVPNLCVPPPSTPFVPGVYTLGVADEWGQSIVLHFQVYGVR